MEKYFNPSSGGSLISNKLASLALQETQGVLDPSKDESKTEAKMKHIYFSAWPINPTRQSEVKEQNSVLQPTKKSPIDGPSAPGPSVFAFVSLDDDKYDNLKKELSTNETDPTSAEEDQVKSEEFETVPPNVLKFFPNDIEPTALVEVIPPNRGGWLWAGTENLKFDIKQNLSVLVPKNSLR